MKRLVLLELTLIFFATTFESDSPPGWFQQTLPRNDVTIQDIFFVDSLTGHVVVRKNTNDSAFIFKTTDGGNSWATTLMESIYLTTIQFVNIDTGYSVGSAPPGLVLKTTNSGSNWFTVALVSGFPLRDVFFVNAATGWTCTEDNFGAGLMKTTNGGLNWQSQLDASFRPARVFFLNNDTGWIAGGNISATLYRTTNGGTNWGPQYTFPQQINDVYFFNKTRGIISSGVNYNTSNGGFNWLPSDDGGVKLTFANDTVGWAGNTFIYVQKTTNGGINWFRQLTNADNPSVFAIDTLESWAAGNKLMHTTDGGGPPIGILYAGTEARSYSLEQNFPNPFNPTTIIFFTLNEKSTVELMIYNILGEQVAEMIDDDHFTAGVYQFGFDATNHDLTSGVYFYRLIAKSEVSGNVFSDTKKMILLK